MAALGLGRMRSPARFALGLALSLATIGATAQPPTAPATASTFVIDSSNGIYALDADGNLAQKLDVDKNKATLNGGITVAMDHVYVTYFQAADGEKSSGVAAFNANTLRPSMLHRGAFKVPAALGPVGILRGIAYDPEKQHFYVASDRLGLLVFDRLGQFVARPVDGLRSVSSVSYDPTRQSIWLVDQRHGVAEFQDAPAPSITQAASAGLRVARDRAAVALSACGTVGQGPAAVVVAFAKIGSRARDLNGGVRGAVGWAQVFDVEHHRWQTPFAGRLENPRGLSCSSKGVVSIATDTGLVVFDSQGAPASAPFVIPGLVAPVLGVASLN